ncbi:hypothetical protein SMICM304S_07947 [Streptomyces microflavus]
MEAGAAPGPLVPFIWSDVELFRAAGRELTVRVSFESAGTRTSRLPPYGWPIR